MTGGLARGGSGGGAVGTTGGLDPREDGGGLEGKLLDTSLGVAPPVEEGVDTDDFWGRGVGAIGGGGGGGGLGFFFGAYRLAISSSTALAARNPLPSRTTRILSSACGLIRPPSQALHTCRATSWPVPDLPLAGPSNLTQHIPSCIPLRLSIFASISRTRPYVRRWLRMASTVVSGLRPVISTAVGGGGGFGPVEVPSSHYIGQHGTQQQRESVRVVRPWRTHLVSKLLETRSMLGRASPALSVLGGHSQSGVFRLYHPSLPFSIDTPPGLAHLLRALFDRFEMDVIVARSWAAERRGGRNVGWEFPFRRGWGRRSIIWRRRRCCSSGKRGWSWSWYACACAHARRLVVRGRIPS
jgi:hypothetical protein